MSQMAEQREYGATEQREAQEYGEGPMRTRPFAYVTSTGEAMPTATERRIARRLLDHRRIRKVSWRTHGKKMSVKTEYGVDFDPILLDDVRQITAEYGGDHYSAELSDEEGYLFVQNQNRA